MGENYIRNRLTLLRAAMEKKGLDALFFTHAANVTYLSAFTGDESYLLITGESCGAKNFFITDSRYIDQAAQECAEFEIIQHSNPFPTVQETIAQLCQEQGAKILGFEKSHISYHLYESIKTACKDTLTFLPTEQLVERLRIVKDKEEAALLRHACVCTDKVFDALCAYIRPGRTEKDIEWKMYTLFHTLHCASSFPPVIASGVRGAMPHGAATDKKLAPGEFLTLDFGCMYKGYHADMTRTVHIGPADAKEKKSITLCWKPIYKQKPSCAPGSAANFQDDTARNHIAEQGYGAHFGHSLGHGVGLEIHEQPVLSPRCKDILQSGTFITVEPGIYISGWGGVRIEDTVLVQEDGIENLFTSTKELICL